MKRSVLLCLFFIPYVFGGVLLAQKHEMEASIDSMLQVLADAKDDTNKVNLLNNVSYALRNINPTSGLEHGQQSRTLAQKLNWKKGIADANYSLGNNYISKSNYSEALKCFQKASQIYGESSDESGNAKILSSLGDLYKIRGNYHDALDYYNSAFNINVKLANNNGKANCYANIGSVYELLGKYPEALDYDLRSLTIFEKIGDKRGVSENLENIGAIYTQQDNYTEALEYYTKAYDIYKQTGNKRGIAGNLENTGRVYRKQGNYSKALDYYNKALFKYGEIGDKLGNSKIQSEIGITYLLQGNYPRALGCDFVALRQLKELGNKQEIAASMANIGMAYKFIANSTIPVKPDENIPEGKAAQISKAKAYLDSAIRFDKEIGDLYSLQQCYKELKDVQELMGDKDAAMESLVMFYNLHDSLYNVEKSKEEARKEEDFIHKGKEDSLTFQKQMTEFELNELTKISQIQRKEDSQNIQLKQLTLTKTQEALQLKETQDTLLTQKNQSYKLEVAQQKERIHQQQLKSYFYIAGIAALLLISFFVLRSFMIQKKLNKVISQLINEREKTIELRTEELSVSNKKLIELIQFNAHNIREPLSRIMGTMKLREYVDDKEFMENYWQMMEKSANDLDNTIKQVIFNAENSNTGK